MASPAPPVRMRPRGLLFHSATPALCSRHGRRRGRETCPRSSMSLIRDSSSGIVLFEHENRSFGQLMHAGLPSGRGPAVVPSTRPDPTPRTFSSTGYNVCSWRRPPETRNRRPADRSAARCRGSTAAAPVSWATGGDSAGFTNRRPWPLPVPISRGLFIASKAPRETALRPGRRRRSPPCEPRNRTADGPDQLGQLGR